MYNHVGTKQSRTEVKLKVHACVQQLILINVQLLSNKDADKAEGPINLVGGGINLCKS